MSSKHLWLDEASERLLIIADNLRLAQLRARLALRSQDPQAIRRAFADLEAANLAVKAACNKSTPAA
jgi:hypothetical protein